MKLQPNELNSFAVGLAKGVFSVEHLLDAFDYDEDLVQSIIERSKLIEPSNEKDDGLDLF